MKKDVCIFLAVVFLVNFPFTSYSDVIYHSMDHNIIINDGAGVNFTHNLDFSNGTENLCIDQLTFSVTLSDYMDGLYDMGDSYSIPYYTKNYPTYQTLEFGKITLENGFEVETGEISDPGVWDAVGETYTFTITELSLSGDDIDASDELSFSDFTDGVYSFNVLSIFGVSVDPWGFDYVTNYLGDFKVVSSSLSMDYHYENTSVPEPSILSLFLLGLTCLCGMAVVRRKK